ncbi:thiol-disulfide oxidoreductase DCC family protein [Natronobeatus ordinarius]|uniref:thiol-disulfide oxidoreductase DCC family protein n=1 Tax=Natronobeatus ordinarius TaxID=2963433 RepID=UPI0020CBB0ED|nr:thiol-disulfide oxidoreductase DCC family protein [Natronobeatus ordinarius]
MAEDVSANHPVLLFDGVCNLCMGSVQFVIRRDPEGVFRFAPLQSPVAEELLEDTDVDPEALDSVVLVDDGDAYEKSDAVLRAAGHLGGIYRLLVPFRYVPRLIRDAVYDVVAARRYDWFGKQEQCMMPTPDISARFLADGPSTGSADTDGDA